MSKDARPQVKTKQTQKNNEILPHVERFITAAILKLKNLWTQETALTGIQFYGDLDD